MAVVALNFKLRRNCIMIWTLCSLHLALFFGFFGGGVLNRPRVVWRHIHAFFGDDLYAKTPFIPNDIV